MFTRLIAKYSKLLIDVLVIGLIILAVIWINPLGMFGGNKLQLQDTANNISSIKEIGQLITAEYYGETIATYKQSKLNLIQEEDISERADDLFRDMKDYLLSKQIESEIEDDDVGESSEGEVKKKKKKGFWSFLFGKKKRKKSFKSTIAIDVSEEKSDKEKEVPSFILDDKETSKEILAFYFKKKKVKDNNIADFLWKLSKEILKKKNRLNNELAFIEYMGKGLPEINGKLFSDFHYAIKEKNEKFKKSTKLSLIGRGSVKAGIDFGELNDDNFIYDKDFAVVHIYGVRPKVLTKDINPWFIPEKRIPGFQILESRNANFEQATEVKKYCIDKLEKMALDAGLLQQAERQSKEAIKNFVGLITNSEIKEVYFHNDSLTRFTDEIIKDEFISFEEARQLDTLIPKQIRKIVEQDTFTKNWLTHQKKAKIQKTRLKNVISNLKNTIYLKRKHHYNRLSYLKSDIIRDGVLTAKEIERVKNERWSIKSLLHDSEDEAPYLNLENKIWHGDGTLSFISHYNELIDDLQNLKDLKIVGASSYKTYTKDSIKILDKAIYTALKSSKSEDTSRYIYKMKNEKVFDSIKLTAFNNLEKSLIYFEKRNKENFNILKVTDSVCQVQEYQDLSKTTFFDLESLKYKIEIPEDWKAKLNTSKDYFDRDKLHNNSIKVVYADSLLYNISKKLHLKNRTLKTKKIKAIRNSESDWEISLEPKDIKDVDKGDLSLKDKEEIIVLYHIAEYYLDKNYSYKWFSKTSDKIKRNVEYKQLGKKLTKSKEWIDKKLVFW